MKTRHGWEVDRPDATMFVWAKIPGSWAALDDSRADELLQTPGLDFCRHHLRTARRYRPHLLTDLTHLFVDTFLVTIGGIALVFLLLAITFIILGIGNSALAGTTNVTNGTIKLGGYFGIATAIAAWYASFAAVVNATFGRVLAPVFPLAGR